VLLAAPAHAVVFVTPGGQPVGGKWQAWADEAKVPTLAGDLTITSPAAIGCLADACSESPDSLVLEADGSAQSVRPAVETALASNVVRFDLYWELGHQFDRAYLTPTDRERFLGLWRTPSAPGGDSIAALSVATENGAEADFAGAYADCALGDPVTPDAGSFQSAPTISPGGTCGLIDEIGQRVGASMPSLPPTVSAVTIQHAYLRRLRKLGKGRKDREPSRRHRRPVARFRTTRRQP
jgi:hypothetical protein